MTPDWLYKLSEWNPQFFREIKGRLKPRNFNLTIAISLGIQTIVLLYFWMALPAKDIPGNKYCTGAIRAYGSFYDQYAGLPACQPLTSPAVNWQGWWFDIFQLLSWMLPFVLLIAGVYMLIGDLGKEERRSTLNFIRLTPQTSQSILFGKILGVPAIPYLGVALAIPLHLWAAIGAGVPLIKVVSIYLFTGIICSFYYTGALLYGFLGGFQGWIGAVAVWFSFSIFFQIWQMSFHNGIRPYPGPSKWFDLPIANHLSLSVAFALLTFGTATFWLWQAVNRRFRNPNTTILSKRQSYLLTACFEAWLIGFVFRDLNSWDRPLYDLMGLALINLFWCLLLIATLTPQRQTLLDWARYRRERVKTARKFWSRSILRDLLWGEKSPSLVAVGVNLLIATSIVIPWILTWSNRTEQAQALLTILFGALFMLICATVAQLILFMKAPKRTLWAAGTVSTLIAAPPSVLGILSFYPEKLPIAWLLSAFASPALVTASASAILISFLCHLSALSLLTLRLTQQLRKAGESESKAVLMGSRA